MTDLEVAALVAEEMGERGYCWWKMTTEDLMGRTIDPTEANRIFDTVADRLGLH